MTLAADLKALRDSIKALASVYCSSEKLRSMIDTPDGYDPRMWSELTKTIGVTAIAVSEDHDGAGGSYVELAAVLEELGRALVPGPLFATTAMAIPLLQACDDPVAVRRWLSPLARAEIRAAVAYRGERPHIAATERGGVWTVRGQTGPVLGASGADLILVPAACESGDAIFGVVLPEPATAIETIDGTDPTRRSARVSFRDAPAHRIAANCAGALRRMMTVARALLAAEQIGVADRCLDMAVEYAGIRTQFGRPIGSFQAIKHLCADTLVEVECARALTADALLGVVAEDPDAEVRSAMAAASSSEACVQSAERGIQVHGAIGYTWEHDCHLYLRRAITSAQLLGAAQDNYGLVATDLLLSAG